MDYQPHFESRIDLKELNETADKIKAEIGKVIIGQHKMIELLLAAIMADGHVLIEGVPGIAKTLTAKLLARSISVGFSRIQFTPDLMPSDVLGTSVFNPNKAAFEFNKGPVFSNIILIDEINRAPAKTQSALIEVMEERQVTIDGNTYIMDNPFLIFATQNPIEQEGTYRLPEAQLDRFMFKINVGYPTLEEEKQILLSNHERKEKKEIEEITPMLTAQQITDYQKKTRLVHIEENLMAYIAQIVDKTRNNNSIYLGGSPRASINTMIGSKALAALRGRDFVTPEDIQEILFPVLRHRILLTPEKEMEGATPEDVIKEIVSTVEVPR